MTGSGGTVSVGSGASVGSAVSVGWGGGVAVTPGPGSSSNAGRPLYEFRLPTDAAIVAVLREGHVVIPQPETIVAGGDEVLALTSADSEPALRTAVVGEGMPGGTPSSQDDGAGAI